jgi:hypothetical protein
MLTREGPIIDKFSYFFPIVKPSFTGPSDIEYINIYYIHEGPVNDGYSLEKKQLNVSVTGPPSPSSDSLLAPENVSSKIVDFGNIAIPYSIFAALHDLK